MAVIRVQPLVPPVAGRVFVLGLAALVATALPARAQAPNPTSADNPFFGSVVAHPLSQASVQLSLDDSVQRGLQNNLGLKEAEEDEATIRGEKNQALQQLLPTITLTGETGFHQHNLAALGFGPGTLAKFATLSAGGTPPTGVSFITRDELTQGQIHFSQTLFSGPAIAGWKAVGAATHVAHFAKMTARGEVVQQVATVYLRCIADSSEVDNSRALLAQDQLLLEHVHEAHLAGIAANLDELRARVQFQAQQQVLIAAQNALEKDQILLKREIGLDAAQPIVLTDPAPYSDLATQTPQEVLAVAYKDRQDYQNLQNQVVEYRAIHSAYRSQRLPTLAFNSYYAVSTVNGAGTHGNFAAIGSLRIPLFREASLRGDEDASRAQLRGIQAQLADLRIHIDEQVRDALLDVNASGQLVQTARSNVDLATRALADETARVNAGVDDNLPLVTAQATLASAQHNLVVSLYQYNLAKLALARSSGVLETQYRAYLGC